jgi:cytochrome P450 family 110
MVIPPGPSNALVHTVRLQLEPYEHLVRCASRYGDPFTLPHAFGAMVMTGRPDGIREIFSADPDTFEVPGKELSHPLLRENSIIMLDGAPHRAARRLLSPSFHGESIRSYSRLVSDAARAHVERRRRGERFELLDLAQRITLDVIVRAVFGVEDPEEIERAGRILLDLMAKAHPAFMFFPPLRRSLLGIGPWDVFVRARDAADALIRRQIARCRRPSILSLLVSATHEDGSPMRPEEIRDEVVTLLLAGYDATASMIAWAWSALGRHPEALRRLRDELAPLGDAPSADDVERLPFLEAVCHETMRMYPILGSVIRKLARPMRLLDREIPAGRVVAAATILAHRREETFPDPLAFRPGRFLDRTYSPFEFLPFGGGARRCIGAAFALHQMKLVLAAIVRGPALRLRSIREPRPVTRGVAVLPADGVPVEVV